MTEISEREITVSLTGAEWFALLVHLNYAKLDDKRLSPIGKTKLKSAQHIITETVTAAAGLSLAGL